MAIKFRIDPPLLNSSSPWATTLEDLKALYKSPHTGAITTRTSLVTGFNDNPNHHQHCFFDATNTANHSGARSIGHHDPPGVPDQSTSSLNTYGYSPVTLPEYISYIKQITAGDGSSEPPTNPKPIIISVTGTPDEIRQSYLLIDDLARSIPTVPLAVEINLSCPNIADKPPPAYDQSSLAEYLDVIHDVKTTLHRVATLFVGLKLPPYTYIGQFRMVVECLRGANARGREEGVGKVVDFITSTNTLGSSLLLDLDDRPVLGSEAGTGIGGMAGSAVHALSLGNVATLRRLLSLHGDTRDVMIIGVGGVSDAAGFRRMKSVGADAVGVATALGRLGIGVFASITAE